MLSVEGKVKENQVLIDVREVLEKSERMLYMDELIELSGYCKRSVTEAIKKIDNLQKNNHRPKQYGLGVKEF